MSSVDGSRDARGNSTFWRLVGCSLLSGLLMQPLKTAGPDGVGELGPNLLYSGYDASDIRRVVPVPGLTGLAITSRRSHNFMEPNVRLELFSASRCHSSPPYSAKLGAWRD